MAFLADTGLLDHGAYAAHCVWCTDDDFRIMREKNVTLVHNPTSNLKLGSGIARIPEAVAAGVKVALGTDGCASNDNLDMFEEMHLASLVHKGRLGDPSALSPWDVIDMATKNGAAALGRRDSGEIAPGKEADLCVVDMSKPHLVPAYDIPALIVHSMHASDVEMTIVGGEIVYERGQWMNVDHGRALYDLRCAVRRLGAGAAFSASGES
jgi:5-methylthioadenosine/S-adenosylhomocysteine deaminase